MITQETIMNGRLILTKSDKGVKIRKINSDPEEIYDEAMDIPDSGYEYEETDIPVDNINY